MLDLSPSRRRSARVLFAAVAIVAAGCGHGGGGGPTPPPPVGAPVITCPVDVTVSVAQAPAPVTYPLPTVTGGSEPVATSCDSVSGASFPFGTTDVICTATDAIQRQAECVFRVIVTSAVQLQGTHILAFGDSITQGEDGTGEMASGYRIKVINPQNYPAVLLGLLQARYPTQASAIAINNAGTAGNFAEDDVDRFADLVRTTPPPDVVLLLEGTNDVNSIGTKRADGTTITPDSIADALRSDAIHATNAGVKLVILSTLLPRVDGRPNAGNSGGIAPTNDAIRDAALPPGAVLIDAFTAFDPQKEMLIGPDGLHPTTAGYALLANLFFTAIQANFEQPVSATPSGFRPLRPAPGAARTGARTAASPGRGLR